MPICLSQKHHFRGIFSQREIVWNAIKQLEGLDENGDEELKDRFLIAVPNGKIQIGDDCFYTFNYANLCRALRELTRVGIYSKDNQEFCYGIWLTPMNEIYYTPSELEAESEETDAALSNSSEPESEPVAEPETEPSTETEDDKETLSEIKVSEQTQ